MSKDFIKNLKKDIAKTKKKLSDLSLLSDDELVVLEFVAKCLALSVRNNIENFHVKHLTDEQMKELNPLIRNAIYSHFIMLSKAKKGDKFCKELLKTLERSIPTYWEKCQLTSL
jgi:hypothetical protein